MNFEELGVRDDLLRGIADMGFETPMPVQEKVIPVLLHMATTTLWLWLRPAPARQPLSACRSYSVSIFPAMCRRHPSLAYA